MSKIGVIVGRFQTPFLSEGHINLITTALEENDTVFIVIGESLLSSNIINNKNPFSVEYRQELISWQFQNNRSRIKFHSLKDVPGDDLAWSVELDHAIVQLVRSYNLFRKASDWSDVTLYGSRDSFLEQYTGNFKSKKIDTQVDVSATEIRAKYLKVVDYIIKNKEDE